MSRTTKPRLRSALIIAASLLPWLVSMYLFYWLDSSGAWSSETPHRGKLSVMILGTGMLLSFLLYSRFSGRKRH